MFGSVMFRLKSKRSWRVKIIFPFPLRFRILDADNVAGGGGDGGRIGGERVGCIVLYIKFM